MCAISVDNLKNRLVVFNIVGLESSNIFSEDLPNIQQIAEEGVYTPVMPVFPAVTSTVQASLLTGKYPNEHGIISNGVYDRLNHYVSFWEQNSSRVKSNRIWDLKERKTADGIESAVLFWQNTLYANSDVVLTPKPLHFEDRTIMWCYSRPSGFYEDVIVPKLGEFDLATYWGPLASYKSSEWITSATEIILETQKPSMLFTYLPHVDYSAQRFGKSSNEVRSDLLRADNMVGKVTDRMKKLGILDRTEVVILSEYPFNDVTGYIDINLLLRDEGLLKFRQIAGYEFIDFEYSEAFAMVDHQVAHIYIKKPDRIKVIRRMLSKNPGIDKLLSTPEEKHDYLIDHPLSGDLIAISEKDKWFTYYWWYDVDVAPPFASMVDIHRKPGYDPVELFFDKNKGCIPLDARLIKGSHGRLPEIDSAASSSIFITSKKSDRVSSILEKGTATSADVGEYLIHSYT